MFSRVLRSADAVDGGAAKATATGEGPSAGSGQGARATGAAFKGPMSEKEARTASAHLDGALGAYFPSMYDLKFDVTDDVARNMLDEISKFLLQLAHITSGVLGTIDVSAVRKIVAENAPMPGVRVDRLPDEEQAPDRDPSTGSGRDHRKNPRGRKHPLLTLVQFALQGVRMLLQITAAVHPNVHGKESLEEKQAREKLKEEERELNKILSGRLCCGPPVRTDCGPGRHTKGFWHIFEKPKLCQTPPAI
jgi:hypothetical protein